MKDNAHTEALATLIELASLPLTLPDSPTAAGIYRAGAKEAQELIASIIRGERKWT